MSRRSARVAAKGADSAVGDEAIASQNVALLERSYGKVQVSFPSWICTDWISLSNSKFMGILDLIKIQLNTHSFNYGELTNVCWLIRTAYKDSKLSDDVEKALDVIGFVWNPLENDYMKSQFRELESTTNEMCREMGLHPKKQQKLPPWSTAEDLRLEVQVKLYGVGKWAQMDMPGRIGMDLFNRWHSSQRVSSSGESKRKNNKNPFTVEEDDRLRSLVGAVAPSSKIPWTKILESFSNRKMHELVDRWKRHLEPLVAEVLASVAVASAAFMTPGVDGAVDDESLLAGLVFVIRGDLGTIDACPMLAHAKLTATLVSFGASVIRSISNKTTHVLIGKGVDAQSKNAIYKASNAACIRRKVVIDISTLQKILLGRQLLTMPALPPPVVPALSPSVVPALSPLEMPALSPPVVLALFPLEMPALPPVEGLDDWTFSSATMPILDENDMDIEVVVPI